MKKLLYVVLLFTNLSIFAQSNKYVIKVNELASHIVIDDSLIYYSDSDCIETCKYKVTIQEGIHNIKVRIFDVEVLDTCINISSSVPEIDLSFDEEKKFFLKEF